MCESVSLFWLIECKGLKNLNKKEIKSKDLQEENWSEVCKLTFFISDCTFKFSDSSSWFLALTCKN